MAKSLIHLAFLERFLELFLEPVRASRRRRRLERARRPASVANRSARAAAPGRPSIDGESRDYDNYRNHNYRKKRMARTIVTQEAVSLAAQTLADQGLDPSILAVQAAIGGGSFSTVKRYLDAWKLERANAALSSAPVPGAVSAKGQEFAGALWAIARAQAQQEVDTVRADATRQLAELKTEVDQAGAEIARLEQLEAQQLAALEKQASQLREAELAHARAQAQAEDMGQHIAKLEAELVQARAQAESSRQAAAEQASKAAQLEGEAKALRAQAAELMATIKSWSPGH